PRSTLFPYTTLFRSSNTANNIIGGATPAARNTISGNARGIQIENSSGNLIQGNYIGTDPSGVLPRTNYAGIVVAGTNSTGNLIGGLDASMRNVISGNGSAIYIMDGASGT